jgi:hypothetical protein
MGHIFQVLYTAATSQHDCGLQPVRYFKQTDMHILKKAFEV